MARTRLKLSTNIDELLAQMDALERRIVDVAVPRTLNRLATVAKTECVKAVGEVYGVNRSVGAYFGVRLASIDDRTSAVTGTGKGWPLTLFPHVDDRRPGGGVIVTIKGRAIRFPHSFLKSIGGNLQVWARGSYRGAFERAGTGGNTRGVKGNRATFVPTGERFGKLAYGRRRFPITLLRSASAPDAISNGAVQDAMSKRIEDEAPAVLARNLKAAARGF